MRRRVLRPRREQRGDEDLKRVFGLRFRDLLDRRQLHAGDGAGQGPHDALDVCGFGIVDLVTSCPASVGPRADASIRAMRRLPAVMLVVLLAGPRALGAQSAPSPEARPADSEARRERLGRATRRAGPEAGRLRHAQHAVGHHVTHARHRRRASMDLRRADALEPEAAGQSSTPTDRAPGTPDHAERRAAQHRGASCRARARAGSTSPRTTTRSTSARPARLAPTRARRPTRRLPIRSVARIRTTTWTLPARTTTEAVPR